MRKKRMVIVFMALAFLGCGGRGAVLSTPKNLAGTRSVVLPGYTPAAPSVERLIQADTAVIADTPVAVAAPVTAAGADAGAAVPAEPAAVPVAAARKKAVPGNIDLEIREKMFIAQTNEVYLNPEDYMGKTIKLEGLFKVEQYVGEPKSYCFVMRYGPGCCGNDGSAGFEVAWGRPEPVTPLSAETVYPEQDAWVEAVGVLDTYEEDGYPYLFLDLFSLTEKKERGAEFVSQ